MPKRTAVDRRAHVQRRKVKSSASFPEAAHPPTWIEPQLTRLAEEAPEGTDWLHEIKYDGYRMHARIDGHKIQLLTRTGLDWSHRYKRTIEALRSLKVKSAYLDGDFCALNADGVPVFSRLPAAKRSGPGSAVHRPATSVRSNKGLCSGNAARYSYGRRLCLSVC